jgi:hypothetical protein
MVSKHVQSQHQVQADSLLYRATDIGNTFPQESAEVSEKLDIYSGDWMTNTYVSGLYCPSCFEKMEQERRKSMIGHIP